MDKKNISGTKVNDGKKKSSSTLKKVYKVTIAKKLLDERFTLKSMRPSYKNDGSGKIDYNHTIFEFLDEDGIDEYIEKFAEEEKEKKERRKKYINKSKEEKEKETETK